MAPEDLLEVLRERPFRPFRMHLTDGRTIDIHHPELVLPGRGTAIIGIPAPGEQDPLYQTTMRLDLLHIFTLEPLPAAQAPPGGNGS
jgi:hypothetical protein